MGVGINGGCLFVNFDPNDLNVSKFVTKSYFIEKVREIMKSEKSAEAM